MIKLSTVIITFNEELNIERCLKSVQEISDEIIVIDNYSTDRTKEICQKYNVLFLENKFEGHIEQKNFAIAQSSHQYILSLDADEALSPTLLTSIKEIKNNFSSDGYSFNRLTFYAGKPIHHCGWYPDRKLRLFKKDQATWSGKNPHDIIKMKDNTLQRHIAGDLLHYSYKSITDHVRQTNKFTSIAAVSTYSSGTRSSILKIVTRPPLKFLRDYFLKLGFLDGRYGFIICCINSLSVLLKYSKIFELQKNKPIE